jgi:hypothetical protein
MVLHINHLTEEISRRDHVPGSAILPGAVGIRRFKRIDLTCGI